MRLLIFIAIGLGTALVDSLGQDETEAAPEKAWSPLAEKAGAEDAKSTAR
jgi:hypothetical protein